MNIPEVLKTDLKHCGYPQLFGSRNMAVRRSTEDFDPAVMMGSQISSNTDWDFSQQYSDQIHNYLISAGYTGYTAEQRDSYVDNLTVAVYEKKFRPSFNLKNIVAYSDAEAVKAHIVLHKDEDLFRRVWNRITPEFYYNYLWKRSRNYIHINDRYKVKRKITAIMNQLYAVAA